MRLLLVRHGESTWNAEGRYQGRRDAPLSPLGIAQARALADHLATQTHDRPRAIVSSPLQRAFDTARAVADALGLEVTTDDRLVEIAHGAWEGLLKTEIAAAWPEMYAAWHTVPESVTFPGGESLAAVRERWLEFTGVCKVHGRSPLLVVTHDVIVRIAILHARGLPLRDFTTFATENAALSRLDLTPTGQQVASMNEHSYLRDLRADPRGQAL